jgi:ADP-ribosylglycohydrolase
MEVSDDTAVTTTVAKGSVNGKGQQKTSKTFLIWKKM